MTVHVVLQVLTFARAGEVLAAARPVVFVHQHVVEWLPPALGQAVHPHVLHRASLFSEVVGLAMNARDAAADLSRPPQHVVEGLPPALQQAVNPHVLQGRARMSGNR